VTKRAPGRWFAHFDDRITTAGGILGDSRAGSELAHRRGYKWVDNNLHLTADLRWVNAHGAPYNPAGLPKGDKFEDHPAAWLHKRIPGLRSARQMFKQNAALGLNTEAEIKDLHPLATHANLVVAFARLAKAAELAYGPDWRKHVQIKVLTNLRGGLPYAMKILEHAHAAGFATIILPRGKDRLRRLNGEAISFNRGGLY
jgi:hypothetical protein